MHALSEGIKTICAGHSPSDNNDSWQSTSVEVEATVVDAGSDVTQICGTRTALQTGRHELRRPVSLVADCDERRCLDDEATEPERISGDRAVEAVDLRWDSVDCSPSGLCTTQHTSRLGQLTTHCKNSCQTAVHKHSKAVATLQVLLGRSEDTITLSVNFLFIKCSIYTAYPPSPCDVVSSPDIVDPF